MRSEEFRLETLGSIGLLDLPTLTEFHSNSTFIVRGKLANIRRLSPSTGELGREAIPITMRNSAATWPLKAIVWLQLTTATLPSIDFLLSLRTYKPLFPISKLMLVIGPSISIELL